MPVDLQHRDLTQGPEPALTDVEGDDVPDAVVTIDRGQIETWLGDGTGC